MEEKKSTSFLSVFLRKARLSKHSKSPVLENSVIEMSQHNHAELELKTYPQAWFALFLLVLLRTAVSVFQFTFSIIPGTTSDYYRVSLTLTNWFANIQCIIYVLMSCFTGYMFEKLGVKRSIVAAGFLLSLGAVIRSIGAIMNPPSYAVSMIGQVIGGCASPMALNIMTMFASTWFTENLRATAGMFVASNYGAILVMFVIPSITNGASDIPLVLNLVSGFCMIVFVSLLLIPSSPPTPPTRVQDEHRPPFFEGLKMLSKNFNFWIVFMIHSLNVGLSIAFCALFAQIIGPHGYPNSVAGQLNAYAFLAGTLGCSAAGPILDFTKQHKLFLRITTPMVLVTALGMIFMIQKNSFASVLFVTSLNQFFLSFLVPVAIEIGSETSYPVSEATTSSLLWQGAQIFGFVFILVMDSTRSGPNAVPGNNMTNALIFQAAVTGLIMLLSFIFNGKMARTESNSLENAAANQPSLEDKAVSATSFPLSSIIGISLADTPQSSAESILLQNN